jgi:antitoxin component YwqK of YwqJK toxin-antitoxin module
MVCISTNNGQSWRMKSLPVTLPHENDRKAGTLGYATACQAPNGVIQILATMTQPCVHYEFNEAWIWSDSGDIASEQGGGSIKKYRENYPGGRMRVEWSARTCPNGRYLLEGREVAYYENGQKQHDVTYANGRKTGIETYWGPDGAIVWRWSHHPENDSSTWVHYWRNGRKRIESNWNTYPQARDLPRKFRGLVANGPAYHWNEDGTPAHAYNFTNGILAGELALPVAQLSASSASDSRTKE